MERIWAPWRMPYLLGDDPEPGCLFCRVIAAPTEQDRENLVLARSGRAFVMLNRYPYTSGHLMVVPVAHVATPDELDGADGKALADLLTDTIVRLRRAAKPDGMNVGMNIGQAAGAGIAEHCHWHLVPRYSGDANVVSVVGQARVIPEALEATWERFGPFFR